MSSHEKNNWKIYTAICSVLVICILIASALYIKCRNFDEDMISLTTYGLPKEPKASIDSCKDYVEVLEILKEDKIAFTEIAYFLYNRVKYKCISGKMCLCTIYSCQCDCSYKLN